MNRRMSPEKRALVLSLLSESMPINGVCRILHVGKHAVLRLIRETGEALSDYMDKKFVNVSVARLEIDECVQYVGIHGSRLKVRDAERGDFWLWAGVDADTKLIVSFRVDRHDWDSGRAFIKDIASRIVGPVQVTTDCHALYTHHMASFFHQPGSSYAQEKKIFFEPFNPKHATWRTKNGVPKLCTSERRNVLGDPQLSTSTTSHIERTFLTVRQEVARFGRMTLAYSKKLEMHKAAIALHIGIFNLCRKHSSLEGKTPAQAAELESKRWTLEDVVALTERHMKAKEDAAFESAFAKGDYNS